jgi:hypothetical protein
MKVYLTTGKSVSIEVGELETTSASEIYLSTNDNRDEVLDFLKMFGHKKSVLSPEYGLIQKALHLTDKEALHAVPKEKVSSRISDVVETLQNVLRCTDNDEYLVTYLSIKRFLRELSAPLVCTQTLKSVMRATEHKPTADRIAQLIPNDSGRPQKTCYNMVGSSTGRLTVKSGPQILTISSKARQSFRSEFKNGKVLQIDLISAEPKIALQVQGKKSPVDLYEYLSRHILEGKVSRKESKLITLSALYGQSAANLKKILPEDVNANIVIRKTKDYFDSSYLERTLKQSHRSRNLRNILGRPLNIPENDERLVVSYFLQSSAAEAAILMFSNWSAEHKDVAVPLYVIHDALIVDCNEELSSSLLQKKNIQLNVGDWSFDAKVTQVSNI